MARAAVRAFIPCRRVAALATPGAPKSPVFTLRWVSHTSLTENDRNPHLRPTSAGVQLNRGGLEVVAWGSGFRQAGGRGSVVGKDPNAGAVGLEKRCCRGSVLWRNTHCGIRHVGDWFALFQLCQPGRIGETERELADAPSASRPAP